MLTIEGISLLHTHTHTLTDNQHINYVHPFFSLSAETPMDSLLALEYVCLMLPFTVHIILYPP